MFFIWSGWGILTLLFVLIGLVAGGSVVSMAGLPAGVAVATVVAAGLNFLMARRLATKRQELVDPKTGQTVILTDRSGLFFIPMRIWTYIILASGVILEVLFVIAEFGGAAASS